MLSVTLSPQDSLVPNAASRISRAAAFWILHTLQSPRLEEGGFAGGMIGMLCC